mgnify:CR=1 FL=1
MIIPTNLKQFYMVIASPRNVVLGVIACFMIQMPLASVFYKIIPRILKRG